MTDDVDTDDAPTDEEISAALGRLAALLVPETDFVDPTSRAVMSALNSTGHYEETAEDFAWLCTDTRAVLAHASTGNPTAIAGALLNTGLHYQDDQHDSEAERACLEHDVAVVGAAIRAEVGGDDAGT